MIKNIRPLICVLFAIVSCAFSSNLRGSDETIGTEIVDFTKIKMQLSLCKTLDDVIALTKCPPGNYTTSTCLWAPPGGAMVTTHMWVNDKSVLFITAGKKVVRVHVGEVYRLPIDAKHK